ncbi:trypsin-like serine protease [Apiospora phragmitis]|uniref:Trypsin-like serine protease n=1 Tax=Apiospora phragmitis TaxID=2905665 RepID=A0ABR1TA82_9PEZI
MSFFHRTLALFLAVTSTVTALPTSNAAQNDVPNQGVGHAAPPPQRDLGPSLSQKERRASSSPVSRRSVIGADNRVYWPSTDYPYSAMGRLYRSDGIVCTGTLIGPRHVTTAKHCLPTDTSVSIEFQPAYDGADRFTSAYVTDVLSVDAGGSDQCNYKDDWAVVILEARLGDARGYMSYDVMDPSKADQAIFYSYGYPSDKSSDVSKPYRQEDITVAGQNSFQCDQYGPLNTNADANGGQSGSPLWLPPDANGARVMCGVMSSSSATVTFFAGGEVWAGAIQYMLSSYP